MENKNLYDSNLLITYKEGDLSLERIEQPIGDYLEDKSHIVVEGDTLQSISHFYYRDSRKWFVIADKNKLDDVFNLEIGTELIIPDIKRLE